MATKRGAVLFVLASALFFLAYSHRVIPTIIAPDLLREFAISSSRLGFVISGYFYGYAISQPIVGVLSDRIGPGRVLALFAFIVTGGLLLGSAASSDWWMFLARILIGFGSGGDWVPGLKIIAQSFRSRRHGILTGILGASATSGGIIATAPYAMLIDVLNWRASFLVLAGLTLTLGCIAFLVSRHRHSVPEEEGTEGVSSMDRGWLFALGSVLRMSIFWWMALGLFVMGAALMTFQGLWGVPFFMESYGLSRIAASKILMFVAIGLVSGSFLFGYLMDRFQRIQGLWLTAGFLLVAGAFIVFTLVPQGLSAGSLTAVCFLIGIGLGPMIYIFKVCPLVFHPRIYGASIGILNVFSFVGTIIYQPLSGAIMDFFSKRGGLGGYQLIFALLAISALLGALASSRIWKTERKLTAQ